MSQSPSWGLPSSPGTNHSRTLFATSGCSRPSWVHCSRKPTQRGSLSLKKKCSLLRSSGVAPLSTEYGFFRSVGAYTAPQTSQLSPYWSFAPHFGHSPLMKRSGRNMCSTGS